MRSKWFRIGCRCAMLLVAVALVFSSSAVAQAESDSKDETEASSGDVTLSIVGGFVDGDSIQEINSAEATLRALHAMRVNGKSLARYQIGVALRPVAESVRSHLDLPEGQGMMVIEVVPKSPAAKAKLQAHDIIVMVGDTVASDRATIGKAIETAEGKELTLKIIRAGKPQAVKVTPRESATAVLRKGQVADDDAFKNLLALTSKMNDAKQKTAIRVVPHQLSIGPRHFDLDKMPKNFSITITKTTDEPVEFSVRRIQEGETKSWDVTSDNLDKLPEEVRDFVRGIVDGRVSSFITAETLEVRPSEFGVTPPNIDVKAIQRAARDQLKVLRPHMEDASDQLQEQLEALRQQIKELAEEVRKLRGDKQSKD